MTVLKRVLIPLGELLVWLIVASFVVFALLSLLPADVRDNRQIVGNK